MSPRSTFKSFVGIGASMAVIGSLVSVGVTSTVPAEAAPARTITIGSKQLVANLPAVEPMYVGYKGTQSFIPKAVAAKKDKRGCNLRQRMIIDLATKKPKVSKGCKMKGGVWTTALGAKVTKPSQLVIGPVMSYKDAWGQGAFAWTPAQRLAWATNTGASGAATRSKAVTNLQATQILVSKAESRAVRNFTGQQEAFTAAIENLPAQIRYYILDQCLIFTLGCVLSASMIGNILGYAYTELVDEARRNAELARCSVIKQFASNATAWGLSVSTETYRAMQEISSKCPALQVSLRMESETFGIKPVTMPTVVPDVYQGDSGDSTAGVTLLSGYPENSAGVPVPSGTFGLTAPVDWGAPGVGTSWVRLWDVGVSWAQMEPTQGNIDFSKLRASIESAESYGARVLYVLGDTPSWANGGKKGNAAPTSNASAVAFINALKAEFGGRIAAYEVWNEGNLDTYWDGSQRQLAELTLGIKNAVGSTSLVLAASTGTRATNSFVTNFSDYLEYLAELGWPIDGYTVHSYPRASAGPVERVELIGQFKTLLALRGAPVKPIWDTELNYGLAGPGKEEPRRDIDDSTGAAYIAQSYIQSIQYGIDVTVWYLWTGTRGYFDLLGVQLDPATPISNAVWNNLRGILNGARMTRCAESGNVYSCQFAPASGAPFTMLWTSEGTASVNVAGLGSQACDLLGNPCQPAVNNQVSVGMLPVRVS